jgi:methionine-rich copper-binding protein CopC
MRRISRIGAAFSAVAIAALVLFAAAPASAHNYLVASNPAEGQTLTELPSEFSVSTNDTLLDLAGDGGGFAIQVTNDAGEYFGDGCFTIRNDTLSTGASLGEAGDYLMRWQLVSSDGHTISGEINFVWHPDADQTIADGLGAPPACGGGTLEDATPTDDAQSTEDDNASVPSGIDASTVIFIAAAVALVIIAGVAIFLISVRRNTGDK